MALQTDTYLQGLDTLLFLRKLSRATKEKAHLLPYQTSLKFDPQRDVDTTKTKSGVVPTTSALETDLETEFINHISDAADMIYDSLLDGDVLEAWVVFRKRINDDGKRYAFYMRATVTEDENDNDPDDNSTRDTTFTVSGTPQRGWLSLPDDIEAELAYVFRGLGVVDETPKNDGTDGDGKAWVADDEGKGHTEEDSDDTSSSSASTSNPSSGN